jgi:biotin-[acetyl-CoA-carboxylase] ligase BirA-like protein
MRVFTDDPAAAAAVLPHTAANAWQRAADLSHREQRLVDALGGAATWSHVVRPADAFWSTVVVVSFSEGSQFQALDRLLGTGERIEEPTAALALSGTGFRGQRDRAWHAARGNLHLSVAVPIDLDVARVGAALSMLPAVASVDAIGEASAGAVKPGIKWVNDILLHDRKVGGVLSAAHTTASRIDDVVWGIGINVGIAPQVEPTPFVPATTCISAAPGGSRITLATLLDAMLQAISRRHTELLREGAAPIYQAYRAQSIVLGRAVRIWEEAGSGPFAEGIVTDITSSLGLEMDGHVGPIGHGRLELVSGAAAPTAIDPMIVAAIASTVAARFPGARVTRVEAEP